MPAIEVTGLSKTFRTYKKQPGFGGAIRGLFRRTYEQTLAVKDVNFSVEPGELVGFLGPNGAGKTTTLKMLAGLLFPTSGTGTVLGYVPWERADGYRRQFALLLGQKNQLWWDLPARSEQTLAVKDVNFSVEPGELVGFLGPNGAGKTTTLKMLAGLLFPTSGTGTVLGYVPWERADGYRRQFALLLGQKNQLWWDLPA